MARGPALRDQIAAGILQAAADLLSERGEQVSMADIAQAAGVSRATVYRYFPNREDLLRGLVRAGIADLRQRIVDAELDQVPVPEGVARLVRGFMQAGSKYAALLGTGAKTPEDLAELEQGVAGPVHDLMARGVTDGTFRPDLPPEVLFEMFTGLLEKGLVLVASRRLRAERASAVVTTTFLSGVSAR